MSELCFLFMPSLLEMIMFHEKQKGSNLTEEEVDDIKNKAIVMTVSETIKDQMEKKRGFVDLNPENVWKEWTEFKLCGKL